MVNSGPSWPRLKEHDILFLNRMEIAKAMASYESLKEELFSSYFPGASKIGKLKGNEFPDKDRSYLIVLMTEYRLQKDGDHSLIRLESSLPATGRSMTGEGTPFAAEVATSFSARLLGAIEELLESSKISE